MRAPPASNRPTIGARARIAMSWILMIFCACVSDSEPPNTVKSLAKTKTLRPLTVPQPVTTPSPAILVVLHAEVVGAVLDEHVELLEGVLVHEELDALARGQFAALVLRLDAPPAAAAARAVAPLFELVDDVLHCLPRLRLASPRRVDASIARVASFARPLWGRASGWSGGRRGCGNASCAPVASAIPRTHPLLAMRMRLGPSKSAGRAVTC